MNFLKKELLYLANNYKTMSKVITKGEGIYLYDHMGNRYMDFMAGYSAINHGHCHPKIIDELIKQSKKLTLCSRGFHNDKLGEYSEYICKLFNYDKILPTNTGVEAGEAAIKLARSYGYNVKKIDKYKAKVVVMHNNFWGRTITAASSSTDPLAYENYGPFTPGFIKIPFNNIDALVDVLSNSEEDICAVMLEPIQGEGGINIPDKDYLKKVRYLCNVFEVLMICDEVQTGLGRMGSITASEEFGVYPDVLLLGKALSGGMFPVSCCLTTEKIMENIAQGSHGSTFGGSPLASAVAKRSLEVLLEENLIENSKKMGEIFREGLNSIVDESIKVRGMGLMNALEFENKSKADKMVDCLTNKGILTKTTKDNVIRLTPPLIINEKQIEDSLSRIENSLEMLNT